MAKYDLELAVISALNDELKDSFGDSELKFERTSRRTSAADLKKASGIDKIKVTMKNKKPFVNVLMFKNFTEANGGWQSLVKSIPTKVKSALKKMDVGQTYDVLSGKPIDKKGELTYESSKFSPETQISAGLSKVATELMLHDFEELDQSSVLRKFMLHIRSGDAVLIPRRLYRSTGMNKVAASMGVTITNPELKSDLVAISRPDLEKVGEEMNISITTDVFSGSSSLDDDEEELKLSASTPEQIAKVREATKEDRESIHDVNKQLRQLENPDNTYKELLELKSKEDQAKKELDSKVEGTPEYEEALKVYEQASLTKNERKMYNLLYQIIEKNMTSLLVKKKELLGKSKNRLQKRIKTVTTSVVKGTPAGVAEKTLSEGGFKDSLQIKLQKAGDYKYYIALTFNGSPVKY
ncbi:hypothetical protein [Vibrio phage Va2]|nr:hypothetical protein [Vibrio phage Va2]